ncbi:unnamed protein product [Cuscuta campestris]|uniref:Protein FAR1-RELATED SEQUENCE n=1 Tax=Cuscuta campestris TaxID=132261 RepID=A0A484KT15_9ASTE|nr:unnamed protein product [Cuscuta campestris]
MTVIAKPTDSAFLKSNAQNNEGESEVEPSIGLEFRSSEDAQEFYNFYATKAGFKIRIGQLYRSRIDGSVISRRFVCYKEGFQTNSRVGCPAFIKVKKDDSGKWVICSINKEHNHELHFSGDISPTQTQKKISPTPRSSTVISARTGLRSLDEDGPSRLLDAKRFRRDEEVGGEPKGEEPCKGLEFASANEAYKFYSTYAAKTGFKVRIGQLFRSKLDGSITSRRFVCSKEGHQHPSRLGCGAFMRIQRQPCGRWMVDRLQSEHNHELARPTTSAAFKEEASIGLDNLEFIDSNGDLNIVLRDREAKTGSDWYNVLLDYFQNRQAADTGFFYAVQMLDGRANLFWADGRSRFSCTQFGDAVVFDTTYRRGNHSVPFASFIGVNHHRQPVLLGCALIADESPESFSWVLQMWQKAMSGRRPVSIIADQDWPIQHSIAQVFPGTHHRLSAWQFFSKEQEHLGALLSLDPHFKFECIYQSHTAHEFDAAWNILINKYNLKDNAWLNDMSRMRKSWVPLYIKATFFAGIPVGGSLNSYFCSYLSPQTPPNEFISCYEKAIEERRDEERREDFESLNLATSIHTKDPIEEQCWRLYTTAIFKVFQKELLECFSYVGLKINVEGAITRYMVQRCGPSSDDRNTVAFNALNLNISCSCKMFEFEGILCRHALKVFQIMNVREVPSRYVLHRWTKKAKHGVLRDVESVGGSQQDLKALMLWSLREEANKFIETAATSLERYKLAFEIMQEGNKTLRWPS